ncbi:MAG: prolyl oligopeptidase family serine peptidase [Firmicutes bacterium]|nr:prolyl oligopeptidase family serine peptidase [Bacillota bacterium]
MDRKSITAKLLAANKSIVDCEWNKNDDGIFFVSNMGDTFQVWTMPARGGFPRQLTVIEQGDVKSIKLSPDGDKLAILVDYDGKEDYRIFVIPAEGGEAKVVSAGLKLTLPPFDWSPDSKRLAVIPEKDGKYNIASFDVESGEIEWHTDSPDLKMELDWAKNGKWIAYTSMYGKMKADICSVDLETKEVRNFTSGFGGENTGPKFSPDCNTIAFTSDAKGSKNAVLMEVETLKSQWIPAKNCEWIFSRWNHKGDKFLCCKNEDAELTVFEWDFPSMKARMVTPGGYSGAGARFSHNDEKLAIALHSAQKTADIYIKEQQSFRKITDTAIFGLQPENFVQPEKIRYKSFDDLEIPALYYKPVDTENYPVVVWIHGGPTAQHFNTWNTIIQLFVLNGIAVFAPNPRGSSGYGKEFENMIYHDWGKADLEDIAGIVEYLKTDSKADTTKVIAAGGSYGGYMTMMAVTKKPELWAAGINLMGPVNLETLYKESAPWLVEVLREKYGFLPPEQDGEFYTDRSPINFISDVKCPLLLIYGKNDPRVTLNEMTQLKERLREDRKYFEEEVLGSEGHSMARLETRIDVFEKMLSFINRHVLHKETPEMVPVDIPPVPSLDEPEPELELPEAGNYDLSSMSTATDIPEFGDIPEMPELPGESESVELDAMTAYNFSDMSGESQGDDELPEIPEIPDMDDLPELPVLP